MKKQLLKYTLPFFLFIVLANHFILSKNWSRSLFAGIFTTIFWVVGMYFFAKWWERRAKEQKKP